MKIRGNRLSFHDILRSYQVLQLQRGNRDKEFLLSIGDKIFSALHELVSFGVLSESTQGKDTFYTYSFLCGPIDEIAIQRGCENMCTFCIASSKKTRSFHLPEKEIITLVQDFHSRGGKKIILIGSNVGAWGCRDTTDYKSSQLPSLISSLLRNTDIDSIEIKSVGMEFVTDSFLSLFSSPRMQACLNYSFQSGSDSVLSAMKRNYTRAQILDVLDKTDSIRREDNIKLQLFFHMIVGFPGETEEDFYQSYEILEKYKVSNINCSQFSGLVLGEKIPASFFENQISDEIKSFRYQKVKALEQKNKQDFLNSQTEIILPAVLYEYDSGRSFKGVTKNGIEVNQSNFSLEGGVFKKGDIVFGKIVNI